MVARVDWQTERHEKCIRIMLPLDDAGRMSIDLRRAGVAGLVRVIKEVLGRGGAQKQAIDRKNARRTQLGRAVGR